MRRDVSSGARPRPAASARRRAGALPTVVLLPVLIACGDGRSAQPADTAGPTSSLASAAAQRAPAGARVQPAPPLPIVSPGDVVSSRAYVGRQVRVTGRCLPSHEGHPLGPAIGAMEVWQLEWEGVAVYVVGRAPGRCTTPSALVDTVTITATVAEDTLPAIGDLPGAPRRYLVSAGEPQRR